MGLREIITLSTGDFNATYTESRILASQELPFVVDAVIYNKSDSNIKLNKFEVFDCDINGECMQVVTLNKVLFSKSLGKEADRTEMQKVQLTYPITPYFVWSFEYKNSLYRVGNLWNTKDMDIL